MKKKPTFEDELISGLESFAGWIVTRQAQPDQVVPFLIGYLHGRPRVIAAFLKLKNAARQRESM
jgi:hypothetical protein